MREGALSACPPGVLASNHDFSELASAPSAALSYERSYSPDPSLCYTVRHARIRPPPPPLMQGVLEFLEDSLEPVIILTCTDPSPPPPPLAGRA